MNGHQLEPLCDALVSAFDQDSLDQLLYFKLNKNREKLVGSGNLQTVVFKLVDVAVREGWLAGLIRAAAGKYPANFDLQRICNETLDLLENAESVTKQGDTLVSQGTEELLSQGTDSSANSRIIGTDESPISKNEPATRFEVSANRESLKDTHQEKSHAPGRLFTKTRTPIMTTVLARWYWLAFALSLIPAVFLVHAWLRADSFDAAEIQLLKQKEGVLMVTIRHRIFGGNFTFNLRDPDATQAEVQPPTRTQELDERSPTTADNISRFSFGPDEIGDRIAPRYLCEILRPSHGLVLKTIKTIRVTQ